MGFIKETKSNQLTKEAQRAIEEGRTIFAPRLNTPMSSSGFTGSISGWAEMIEAIESCGWSLEHWAIAHDDRHRPGAYPVFRRRPTPGL